MDESIRDVDKKINELLTQVSRLTTWAQTTSKSLQNFRMQFMAIQIANQTMLDAIFNAIPQSKKLSIETLQLILEKRDKSNTKDDVFDQQIQLALKHLLLQTPLSPEERRKQFYLVEKGDKAH